MSEREESINVIIGIKRLQGDIVQLITYTYFSSHISDYFIVLFLKAFANWPSFVMTGIVHNMFKMIANRKNTFFFFFFLVKWHNRSIINCSWELTIPDAKIGLRVNPFIVNFNFWILLTEEERWTTRPFPPHQFAGRYTLFPNLPDTFRDAYATCLEYRLHTQ